MRISHVAAHTLAFVCLLGGATLLRAQPPAPVQGPTPPEAPPTYELDKSGKRAHIDFTLKVKPISDANLQLSRFQGHKTLVFYFSAKCPHCQHAFPYIQKLSDSLTSKGVTTIAITIKYNSDEDIHNFIRDFKVRMPVFQDEDRVFGDAYGTGYVPMILLVNEKNEYIRYKAFNDDETVALIMKEAKLLAKK